MIDSLYTEHVNCAAHLQTALLPDVAKHTVARVCKFVRQYNIQFDAIACRGLSGFLIAPIVAMRLRKTLICVRKGEKTHSCNEVEGDYSAKTYIILDDFIDSGDTVNAIVSSIKMVNKEAQCVGFIAYERLHGKDPLDECKERVFLTPEDLKEQHEVEGL